MTAMLPNDVLLADEITSTDPSENAALLRQIYDYETVQLSKGDHCRKLKFAATNQFICYEEKIGAELHSVGTLRGDRFAIAIPRRDGDFRFWGKDICQQHLPVSKSGTEMQIRQGSGLELIVLLWDRSLILEACDNPLISPRSKQQLECFLESGGQSNQFVQPPKGVSCGWADFFASQLAVLQARQDVLTAERFNSLAVGTLLSFTDECVFKAAEKMSRLRAWELVSRAMELDSCNLNLPCMIPLLCGQLGCSRRKLELAFRETVKMSPAKYLSSMRLNRIYRELVSSDPDVSSVTAIAGKYGFAELGRFAGYYKRVFGESPRQSLRANRRSSEIIVPSA
ncbi:helix-turn-helix domain-containing protein [bacterium]|nr:helix-turn-helix domain-containing protein [bacterium]